MKCFITVHSAGVAVTVIPVMMKVPAKNRSLHTARFDTWAPSIASGYTGLPFYSVSYQFVKCLRCIIDESCGLPL